MTWLELLASVALAAVAAFGILRPYRDGGAPALQRLSDPLDDERAALLGALHELDDERDSGALSAHDHAALRAATEVRAVAVLRALEARDRSGELAAGVRELRPRGGGIEPEPGPDAGPGPQPRPRPRRGPIAALVVGGLLALGIVPLLIGAVSNRDVSGALSGDTGIGGSPATSASPAAVDAALPAFERRVRRSPRDVAARLDLADRYVRDGKTGLAAVQFSEVLRMDPRNVEAHTGLAAILFADGRSDDALFLVDDALAVSPTDPEALYQKGIILLKGKRLPQEAAVAFRAYLAAAPFGAHRDEVNALLAGMSSPP
jgi:Tetratricopeptide repeat